MVGVSLFLLVGGCGGGEFVLFHVASDLHLLPRGQPGRSLFVFVPCYGFWEVACSVLEPN